MSALLPCALAATQLAGCFEPTNPCDPAADPALQAAGTRIDATVVDQDGNALAGVLVGVTGRAETQVSGLGGEISFADLPPSGGYELVALPTAPLVGGRARTAALECQSQLDGVEIVVIVPPESPEVEIVRATAENRLFVAFGAVGAVDPGEVAAFFDAGDAARDPFDVNADCAARADSAPLRYRLQVRAPFGEWRDAQLSAYPWVDPVAVGAAVGVGGGGDGVSAGERTVEEYSLVATDDVCGAALCARFSYLDDALDDPRARCAEVVGTVAVDPLTGATSLEPLVSYGSYQVRARAELRVDETQRATFTLPERVLAAAPALPAQMSLLPGSLLPIVDGSGAPRAVGEIRAIQPTAGGRFALVEDDNIELIGDGADVLDETAERAVGEAGVAQGAFGEDAEGAAAVANDFGGGVAPTLPVRPVAVLPAGDWLRVIRSVDDGVATTTSIEKVYVGVDASSVRSGPDALSALANAEEPALTIDPESGAELRGFSYMLPAGAVVEAGVNPRDAYVLLYGSAFVLVEQGRPDEIALSYFATVAATDVTTGDVGSGWAGDTEARDAAAAFSGACDGLRAAGDPNDVSTLAGGERVRVAVCYDVGSALGEEVDLRDIEVLGGVTGARHLVADARNDRIFVADTDAVVCAGCTNTSATALATQLEEVRVGREPVALIGARALDCGGGGAPRDVVLVANHGSGDLSVLEDVAGEVQETSVIPLPALPAGFLEDPTGATCSDPFVWVLGDDGQVIPVDMRGEPSVPLCAGTTCAVGTRGRGFVGGVQRRPGLPGPGRALVGGPGLLGELGFFRPSALRGAAYASSDDLTASAPPAP